MQFDLFGNPLGKTQRVDYLAHVLKNHKIKYYKKCAGHVLENGKLIDCPIPVVNKPCNHYCSNHILEFYIANDLVVKPIEVVAS